MGRDTALILWATLRDRVIVDAAALPQAISDMSSHVRTSLHVSGAGVLLASSGQRRAVLGASDERMRRVEQFQATFDEGPCMDAYLGGVFVGAPDLATHDALRWPSFGPAAVSAGVAAAFSFPLTVGEIALGALDCYRVRTGALTPTQISVGHLLADIVADLMMHAQVGGGVDAMIDQMIRSNSAHDRIEQARGITAYDIGISVQMSLELMRDHARLHQLSLDEVAHMIVGGRLRLNSAC